MTDKRKGRLLTRAAAVGVLVATAAGVGVAQAAANPPPLAFVAATNAVTASRFVYDGQAYLSMDLGLHMIAGSEPVEIWAHRTGYDKPFVAERTVKKKKVALPAGTVTDLSGLKDFTAISIADEAGAAVKNYQTAFCANSGGPARTRPAAPATNPYPTQCGDYNPFTLGAVWGIQAGWHASVPDQPASRDFALQPGKYTATV